MDIRHFIIANTQRAVEDLFRVAKAVPADKLHWKPLDNSRSVMSMVAECALSPMWGAGLLAVREFKMEPGMMEKFYAERDAISSVEEAENLCLENCEKLYAAIRSFPAEDMDKTMNLPFGPRQDWPFSQIMNLHMWNCTYHLGQVAYVQTLYGDFDSH